MKKRRARVPSSLFSCPFPFFFTTTMTRRRHHGRFPLPSISVSAAFTAAVLILLVVISFLSFTAPPPIGVHDSQPRDLELFSDVGRDESDDSEMIFQVPRGGGSWKPELWRSKMAQNYIGCSNASKKFSAGTRTHTDRYLAIVTSGGLNQQRTGITDAVVAARILNATLAVPKLDQKSFWKDTSDFAEIFDVDWFISFLSKDVKIIKDLPKKGGKIIRAPYNMRVPRKCTQKCYQVRVLPILMKKHAVQLSKFDYRLANRLDTDLQKLRCRVNYHALRFTNSIRNMGEKLISRMKAKSKHFIALHLRFEPDMLAFSGCYYGGGEKESRELGTIRKRWKTLHTSNPEKERRHGKCPLTPEEVGLMLRALGYGDDTHIYVASGEVYGGEYTLAPLKALFPNFHSKETLATNEELAPFSSFSSRMAALDFVVCDESDAFVTNNNGNMARILAGRRRYFGHKRTVRPNAKKLYSLFLNRANLTWDVFASKVRSYQRGFMGEPNEVRPGRGEFHENPSTCICENPEARKLGSATQSQPKDDTRGRMENLSKHADQATSDHDIDEVDSDQDQLDGDGELELPDYEENLSQSTAASNGTELGFESSVKPGDDELEEMLSD